VKGDKAVERDEQFTVNLTAAENAIIEKGVGVGTIRNDDRAPAPRATIRINDESAFERGPGRRVPITFTISLDRPVTQTVKVSYSTTGGTARAGTDFVSASGVLTFSPGQTQKRVTVLVIGDSLDEADETFFVRLSTPVNAQIADAMGRGLIRDDD
jgi:chitinase